MKAILSQNSYGKSAIRLLKVIRNNEVHDIKEMIVNIQLDGDFETVHTEGDNSMVLPTDTMKNTVYALAKENPCSCIEEFGLFLSGYLLDNNKQVSKVNVKIEEKIWQRIFTEDKVTGKLIPHNHSFISGGDERRTAEISHSHDGSLVRSGITGLLVLKTTGSGFENYVKDKYTTLKETADRVFSTSIRAVWEYNNQDINYLNISSNVRKIILQTFASQHSLSVQHTLYHTGKNVIDELKDISAINLSMPNKHYLLFNLDQFGINNNNEIFIPVDEPFGLIEATIERQA